MPAYGSNAVESSVRNMTLPIYVKIKTSGSLSFFSLVPWKTPPPKKKARCTCSRCELMFMKISVSMLLLLYSKYHRGWSDEQKRPHRDGWNDILRMICTSYIHNRSRTIERARFVKTQIGSKYMPKKKRKRKNQPKTKKNSGSALMVRSAVCNSKTNREAGERVVELDI